MGGVMSASAEGVDIHSLLRQGTARNKTGRRTAVKIIEAACDILRTDGYERFSMQGIARRLGIRLSNVQYYFATRNDLIKAVMNYTGQMYMNRYREILDQAPDNAEDRFRAIVDFNFKDIGDNNTRHFFIQLWPLISSADNYSGELLRQFYSVQLEYLAERIEELAPGIDPSEARIRAETIAAMVEGFMVTAPASVDTTAHRNQLRQKVIDVAFAIARGGDGQMP